MSPDARESQPEPSGRLAVALRRLGTASTLHSQAVARRVGLTPVDLECLDMIVLDGPVTAGRIALHTGLTTGAVTGLVDRLERKGYVERVSDPGDRRKVMVRAIPANIAPVQAQFRAMAEATSALMATYPPQDLALIAGFIERGTALLVTRATDLNAP